MFDLSIDNLADFFDQGGYVLYFVFIVAFILWTFLIERFIYIAFKYEKYHKSIISQINNINSTNKYKNQIKQYFFIQSCKNLNAHQSFIKICIVICPLIGLLGTVTGMIEVFDVMALSGASNVKSMASGVSMATIPTMAGMVVALSGLLFEKRISSSTKYKTQALKIELSKVK